jgi:hypothetical protein
VGTDGPHGLRAPVGLVTHPPARRPYLCTSRALQDGHKPVGIGEKSRKTGPRRAMKRLLVPGRRSAARHGLARVQVRRHRIGLT